MRHSRKWTGVWLGVVLGIAATGAAVTSAETPARRGVLQGYPQGKYAPDKPVTRRETVITIRRVQRAVQSDVNAAPKPEPPAVAVTRPDEPSSRLFLAIHLARLLRALEQNPGAAQPAAPPKQKVEPASLPARIPRFARDDLAYLVARGYPVALPHLYQELNRPALQKDVTAALTWALGSLASRGYIPPGDLAPPPPEPEPRP